MKNKKLNLYVLIFILTLVVSLLGYNYVKQPFKDRFEQLLSQNQAASPVAKVPTPTPDLRNKVWQQLNPRQKISQLIAMPYVVDQKKELKQQLQWLETNPVGFVTLFGSKLSKQEVEEEIAVIKDSFANNLPPVLIAVDHEGGTVQRLSGKGFTRLKSFRQICETETASEAAQLYKQSAQELFEVGVNIVFAPVVDLAVKNSPMYERSCSLDKETTNDYAVEYILAFAEQGIMSVLKHFPGIGSSQKDLHYQTESLSLNNDDAVIFKEILDQAPNIGVMSAHVNIDQVLEGKPCSLNKECLKTLRENYSEAIIFSDALDMESALAAVDVDQAGEAASLEGETAKISKLKLLSKQAVLAGNDVLVFGKGVEVEELTKVIDFLVDEYQSDEEFAKVVDATGFKLLSLKRLF